MVDGEEDVDMDIPDGMGKRDSAWFSDKPGPNLSRSPWGKL